MTKQPPSVPPSGDRPIALRVTPAAERAVRRGHPWLFEGAIRRQSRSGRPGDLAVVFDRKGRFLAVGLYDPAQPIRVRVLQQGEPAVIDENWLRRRLIAAQERRAGLQASGTTGYRLVHGENDGLPGLVIDRYAETAVLKLYTAAWVPHLVAVLAALQSVAHSQLIVLRLSRSLPRQAQHLCGLGDGQVLAGSLPQEPLVFQENGLWFQVDPLHGHKTGFYLDQRDNRARVEGLAGGRQVLNLFAYTGGFSVYAARGGASRVTSVDVSSPALEGAERNVRLNRSYPTVAAARFDYVQADAFAALDRLRQEGRRFGLVILDPPAFAQRLDQAERALDAYRQLTRLALGVLGADGILVQASCSSRVESGAFFEAVHAAARQVGRPLQEIARTGHPLDHPIGFPEGAYLKCLFARGP